MAPLLQTRVVTLADAAPMVDFLFVDEPAIDEAAWAKAMAPAWAGELLDRVIAAYADAPWTADTLNETWRAIADELGAKPKLAQAPVRVAVTGRPVGPPLFESLEVLGARRDAAAAAGGAGRGVPAAS